MSLLRPGTGRRSGAGAASVLGHVLLLAALLLASVASPSEPPAPDSIDVEIVGSSPPAPPAPAAGPSTSAAEPASPVPAPAVPSLAAAVPSPPPAGDGMIRPTHLLTGGLLKEAASRQVRETLPKLAPGERVTQLCNIEATEQIGAADPASFPDTVRASAFADTSVDGLTITAPGAVYRSRRRWYAVSFVCTVAADYQSVADFRFKVGPPIPQDQWEAHYLNAQDADE